MKKPSLAEIDEKIARLKKEKRIREHEQRETEKKRIQKLCFNVGELFIKHFPDIRNLEPGTKSENAKIFEPLDTFLDLLASDKHIMEMFNECLTCKQDDQAQCVNEPLVLSPIRSNRKDN